MYRILQTLLITLCLLVSAHVTGSRAADDLGALVSALGTAKLAELDDRIAALAKSGDPRVIPVLEALGEGNLYARKTDGGVFLTTEKGASLVLSQSA